jgi:hypothetical protein
MKKGSRAAAGAISRCSVARGREGKGRGGLRACARAEGISWRDVCSSMAVGNGPQPLSAGGGAVTRIGEGGGAPVMRRCATDKRSRVSQGLDVSGGVWEGERRVRQHGGGAPTCGPKHHSARQRGLNW